MEKLYELWANRNPEWETKYEDSVIKTFCDYGRGTTVFQEARGKIFGAGYEILIIALFIGLYNKKRKQLVGDTSKRKTLGQPIKYWGNLDSKPGRVSYSNIRKYIFAALVARSDVDYIALDKGDITNRKAVDILMTTMEEYINWGLDFIEEKMEDNPNYFFKDTAFLRIFLDFLPQYPAEPQDDIDSELGDDEMPESLD
jgi:hypothetical protein